MFNSHFYKVPLAAGLILLGSAAMFAEQQSQTSEKPPAKSAPAKPGAKPATGKATHAGAPGANGTAHTGPATHGPTANGTNAAHPSANPSANRPMAGSPAARNVPARPMNTGIHGGPAPVGAHVQTLRGGSALQRRPDGRISDVHDARRGMDIHHELNGGRRVVVLRADHSRVFAERGRRGFIERPYMFHGHEFARRNYYYHGHMYSAFYRGYSYRGLDIHIYAPVRYYPVGFYGWAYHPWRAPIVYAWAPAPWAGYYGFYFAPYPAYATASLWLTDYMIQNDLAAAYEAGQESATLPPAEQASDAPVMTPEVKQMIADEVRAEIALENSEAQQNAANQEIDPASSSIARLLADGRPHVFVVGSPLDVVDQSGTECALSEGDALELAAPPPPDATAAPLIVLASKGRSECGRSANVVVALADLQEMQNHMRETIDRGMAELQEKQGQGGLPSAPPSAKAAPVAPAFADVAPPPDPNDANDIDQQMKAADQSEQDLTAQAKQAQ